jgi:anaerobic magnesium-protoporphyrin IX monomethyl ester cyclase
MILNLPSPPGMDVERDYSGGYGTAGVAHREDYGHSYGVVFPVFMPYLATAILRQGWLLEVVDGQALRLGLHDTLLAVTSQRPDFLVSLVSLPSLYADLDLLRLIKRNVAQTTILVVGTTARVLNEQISASQAADFVIDAEYPFFAEPVADLVRAWQAGKRPAEQIIRPRVDDRTSDSGGLNDLDLDVYRKFPMRYYRYCFHGTGGELVNYFPILSSKGCPFPCVYCPYPFGFGTTISYKSPENVVQEMELLHNTFGIRAFLFRDQVFTANHERVERICDLILRRQLNVEWMFETRVDGVSKELLRKVRHAGCNRIHYGIETGDDDLLRRMGKPGVDKQTAIEAFRDTAALGIRTAAHVIVGLPGETRRTLDNTYKFLGELDPDNTSWNFATPYPGTELFEEARREGLLLTCDWTKYTTNQVVMRTQELSGPELAQIARRLAQQDRTRKVLRRVKRAFRNGRDREYVIHRSLDKLAGAMRSIVPRPKRRIVGTASLRSR